MEKLYKRKYFATVYHDGLRDEFEVDRVTRDENGLLQYRFEVDGCFFSLPMRSIRKLRVELVNEHKKIEFEKSVYDPTPISFQDYFGELLE